MEVFLEHFREKNMERYFFSYHTVDANEMIKRSHRREKPPRRAADFLFLRLQRDLSRQLKISMPVYDIEGYAP